MQWSVCGGIFLDIFSHDGGHILCVEWIFFFPYITCNTSTSTNNEKKIFSFASAQLIVKVKEFICRHGMMTHFSILLQLTIKFIETYFWPSNDNDNRGLYFTRAFAYVDYYYWNRLVLVRLSQFIVELHSAIHDTPINLVFQTVWICMSVCCRTCLHQNNIEWYSMCWCARHRQSCLHQSTYFGNRNRNVDSISHRRCNIRKWFCRIVYKWNDIINNYQHSGAPESDISSNHVRFDSK